MNRHRGPLLGAVILSLSAWTVGLDPQGAAFATDNPTAPEARQRAEELLREPEFNTTPTTGTPLQRSARQVERWLRSPSTTVAPKTRPATTQPKQSQPPAPKKPLKAPATDGLRALVEIIVIVVACIVVIGLGALLVRWLIRRSRAEKKPKKNKKYAKDKSGATPQAAEDLDPDTIDIREPEQLDALAEDAERAGDFSRAVRLRFRAGLLRLDARRILPFDSSLTTGQLVRALRNPSFDDLAQQFDVVVYARIPADAAAAAAARVGWARVLAECTTTVTSGASS
ncbi:MAG: hypothetical protein ACOYN3_09680 [Acidimicrobiia bacterium]